MNTPRPSYGIPDDVVNSIPRDSAYPGGKSMGMPAANRFRRAASSVPVTQNANVSAMPMNWRPIIILGIVIALIYWYATKG